LSAFPGPIGLGLIEASRDFRSIKVAEFALTVAPVQLPHYPEVEHGTS
jgi:hypothetical protein